MARHRKSPLSDSALPIPLWSELNKILLLHATILIDHIPDMEEIKKEFKGIKWQTLFDTEHTMPYPLGSEKNEILLMHHVIMWRGHVPIMKDIGQADKEYNNRQCLTSWSRPSPHPGPICDNI